MINANVIDDNAMRPSYFNVHFFYKPVNFLNDKNWTLCSMDVSMKPMSMIMYYERWKQAYNAFNTKTMIFINVSNRNII